jgi:SAM-dependent methyltransferase
MADHRIFAAVYDRCLAASEAAGLADRRSRLLAQATGQVLEIGAGTGLNLPYYRPDAVSSVVALEPDGAMRRRLVGRRKDAPVVVRVEADGVDTADLPDGAFDTVVSTLVLCTVPDLSAAAARIRRWLAPGGRLLFLEHVRASGWWSKAQGAATPVWSMVAGGCHLNRDTLGALRGAGLLIADCERFALPAGGPLLRACVQGVAKPLAVPTMPVSQAFDRGTP